MGREHTYVIDGKPWRVKWVPRSRLAGDDGACNRRLRLVRIADGQTAEAELGSVIHELIHARLWDLDHGVIEELEALLSQAVWDCIGGT